MKDMVKMQIWVSDFHASAMKFHALKVKMPVSRIVAQVIDKTLSNPDPFEYDLTIPRDDLVEGAYAHEGGIFMDYMKTLKNGIGLDMLMVRRQDLGIPDSSVMLTVFGICLDAGMIEAFKPTHHVTNRPDFPEDYVYYRVPRTDTPRVKRKRGSQYEQWVKLNKKFANKEG